MKFSIRLLYLYLFSFIGLIIAVIGSIRILELGIKVYIFKGADEYSYTQPAKISPDGIEIELSEEEKARQRSDQETETKRQRERELSGALAMILVGVPLYKYHWKTIQKEGRNK